MSEEQSQHTALNAALDKIAKPKISERVLGELIYTASETGILPFRIDNDDLFTILRLAALAQTYASLKNVPDELRM